MWFCGQLVNQAPCSGPPTLGGYPCLNIEEGDPQIWDTPWGQSVYWQFFDLLGGLHSQSRDNTVI